MTRRLIAVVALLLPVIVHAHSRSESFSEWRIDGGDVVARFTMAAREVTRLPTYAGGSAPVELLITEHLRDRVSVVSNSGPCALQSDDALAAAPGFVKVELGFVCASAPVAIEYGAMFAVAPSHVHYARLFSRGELFAEALLTDARRSWLLTAQQQRREPATLLAWLRLGMQHIVGGYDHIAFIIGLLLLGRNPRDTIVAVTGFTIGHSISLAAAVYGLVSADARLVEALIGFTVALVAVEYFAQGARDSAPMTIAFSLFVVLVALCGMALGTANAATVIACSGMAVFAYCYLTLAAGQRAPGNRLAVLLAVTGLFGLIHGFGFAGFLIESGARGASLAGPLIGFNIGVEIGQLAVVASLVLLARLSKPLLRPPGPQLVASTLCAAGVYWYVTRTIS